MNRLNRQLLLCAATLAATSAAGCATHGAASGVANDDTEIAALQAPAGPVLAKPDPSVPYFVSVTPNGTGCPAGTTNTSISSDGQVFTTTFSAYEITIDPSIYQLTRDCTLAIKLKSPQGLSYAVYSFYYSGYAFLDEGVTGNQTARYWFQGNPVPPTTSNRTSIKGPADKDFVFKDDVGIKDAVWSPCGVERDLNVYTRLQVVNGTTRANGYMNVAAVDGSTKLEFRLAWKSCGDAGIPAPILPDAGVIRK